MIVVFPEQRELRITGRKLLVFECTLLIRFPMIIKTQEFDEIEDS